MYRRRMILARRAAELVRTAWFDALVVALVVLVLLEIRLSEDVEGPAAWLSLLTLGWALPLLARRRAPILAPTLVFAGVTVQALLWGHSVGYSFGTFMLVLLAAGLYGTNLRTPPLRLAGAAVVVAAVVVVFARDDEAVWTDALTTAPMIGVAWLVGHVVRVNGERTAELRERAARLEREREAEARAAAAEERARIAREMHDVVAHSLSVMVIQAEAAEEMIGVDPGRARGPLAAVQDTGRAALAELRRTLGVMRRAEAPELAPQPGLAGLDRLARQVREAGLPVSVRVEGEPRPLPAAADLQAYRIVQEALTNALRHAGPARAEVLVRYDPGEVLVEVTDDGRGHDPAADPGGQGLVGMRERVAVVGGELTAGTRPEGGFAVVARLPTDDGARR